MANTIMNAQDAISGSLAECYITIDGTRYQFMQITKFKAEIKKNKVKVALLGQTGKGNKSSSWEGTFTGTAYYNQSILRRMLLAYKNSGVDSYFTAQVTNEDPASSVGSQTTILKKCNLDGGTIAFLDATADSLEEDISGTFDDFDMPEEFSLLDGMV
ncbi:MAG: phage tail tube protein [Clostridiaceae bacterium]|jgi:hypothetical protein|nr:phage tail tube protein [Clostridiaceae bacterium]